MVKLRAALQEYMTKKNAGPGFYLIIYNILIR